jgi:cation transport ATPase
MKKRFEKRKNKMENGSIQKRNAKIDLLIMASVLIFIPVFVLSQSELKRFINDGSINVLLRTLAAALAEYIGFGLGPTIVMIYRKERFKDYGLVTKGLLPAVLLSVACLIPYFLYYYEKGTLNTYLPFHTIWITKYLYASGFPYNGIGIAIVALTWGFWEGFSYVVISEKINRAVNKSLGWFSPGAIICAVFCILIHGVIGITPDGIFEAIACFILIAGMLTVKEKTGNAWGCVLIFLFFWNAI